MNLETVQNLVLLGNIAPLPRPLPPPHEIRRLLANRVAELRAEMDQLDPQTHFEDFHSRRIACFRIERQLNALPSTETPPNQQATSEIDPASCGADAVSSGGHAAPTRADADPSASSSANPPASTINLANLKRSLRETAEDLRHRLDRRSPIDNLPPEEQRIIYELILERHFLDDIVEALRLPKPIGLNFETSSSSLLRFKKRYAQALQLEQESLQAQQARELKTQLGAAPDPAAAFQAIAQNLIQSRFLDLFTANAPVEAIDQHIQILNRLRSAHLAERKQTLAEQKHAASK